MITTRSMMRDEHACDVRSGFANGNGTMTWAGCELGESILVKSHQPAFTVAGTSPDRKSVSGNVSHDMCISEKLWEVAGMERSCWVFGLKIFPGETAAEPRSGVPTCHRRANTLSDEAITRCNQGFGKLASKSKHGH